MVELRSNASRLDRSLGYERALVDTRAQARLEDGWIDIDVKGALVSPFTGQVSRDLPSGLHGFATRHAGPTHASWT